MRVQRCGDRAFYRIEDLMSVTQPYVALGRVHVRVYVFGRQREEKDAVWLTPDHCERRVARRPRTCEQGTAEQASVDEEQLHAAIGPVVAGRADVAAQRSVQSTRRRG